MGAVCLQHTSNQAGCHQPAGEARPAASAASGKCDGSSMLTAGCFHLEMHIASECAPVDRSLLMRGIITSASALCPYSSQDLANKQAREHDQHLASGNSNCVDPTSQTRAASDTTRHSATTMQARETGICPIREELYAQCFDELIRQVTINCAERGLLLLRVRDEMRMTTAAYQVSGGPCAPAGRACSCCLPCHTGTQQQRSTQKQPTAEPQPCTCAALQFGPCLPLSRWHHAATGTPAQ